MPAGTLPADGFKTPLALHHPWRAARCQPPSTALRTKLVSCGETGRLRGAALLSVVEPADLGQLDDFSHGGRLDISRVRRILAQGEVSPGEPVVLEVGSQEPVKMAVPRQNPVCLEVGGYGG